MSMSRTQPMPFDRSGAAPAELAPTFSFKGIAVHPDHELEFSDSSSSSGSLSIDREDDLDELLELETFGLDSPTWSPERGARAASRSQDSLSSAGTDDYFSYSIFTSSTSSLTHSSPASSASSTPTLESPIKSRPLSDIPAQTIHQPASHIAYTIQTPSKVSRTASVPALYHPYSRPITPPSNSSTTFSGAPMLRSVSLPVTTQRQHEENSYLRSVQQERAQQQAAPALVRSQSSAAFLHVAAQGSASSDMSRSGSVGSAMSRAPVHLPFGEGWGAQLPKRVVEPEVVIPYPYNLLPTSPRRPSPLARTHSAVDVTGTLSVSSPTPRRASLFPFTPILDPAASTEPKAPQLRAPTRLARGMSF